MMPGGTVVEEIVDTYVRFVMIFLHFSSFFAVVLFIALN